MERIVKTLSNEILTEWGFHFDGFYWIKSDLPIKLQKGNDGKYIVQIENVPIGQNPPPIDTNSKLIQLILAFAGNYIQMKVKDKKFLNQKAQGMAIANALSEFMNFDKNIRMRLSMGNMGQGGLTPDNEYTHTLISGIELEFHVIHENKENGPALDVIYYNPECISYNFLRSLFNDDEIKSVSVIGIDEKGEKVETPFFGCGLPKMM